MLLANLPDDTFAVCAVVLFVAACVVLELIASIVQAVSEARTQKTLTVSLSTLRDELLAKALVPVRPRPTQPQPHATYGVWVSSPPPKPLTLPKSSKQHPDRGSPVQFYEGTAPLDDVRFHLDECASCVLGMLRAAGLDVTSTPEAGLVGASDPKQLRFAASRRRILITFDHHFKRWALEMNHAGVLYCEGGATRANKREVLRWCLLIAANKGGQRRES